jgi:glutamine amidotransferase
MSRLTVGVVNYGMGNHASVVHCLHDLGYRVRIGASPAELNQADLLVLPGVGAFPAAMATLHELGLVNYLQEYVRFGRPLIGICLGMQLLATMSCEHVDTAGLDLIPGNFVPFPSNDVHIGWNTLEISSLNSAWSVSDGESFYFNHSYYYQGPKEFQVAITRSPSVFAPAIQRGRVVGLQFHPEKSQASGRKLLCNLISELSDA